METLTVKQLQKWLAAHEKWSARIHDDGEIAIFGEGGPAHHNLETLTETILGGQSEPVNDKKVRGEIESAFVAGFICAGGEADEAASQATQYFALVHSDDIKQTDQDNGKPSWGDAPDWATWIAQDYDGSWTWYENKPVQGSALWRMTGGESEFARKDKRTNDDWRETLEHRPAAFVSCGAHNHTDIGVTVSSESGKQSGVDATLQERGSRYGDFAGHAKITQRIKRAMECSQNWKYLSDDMKEALEMIAHKIGRILNGDPEYLDSWHDIIGYTRLIEQRLENGARTDG